MRQLRSVARWVFICATCTIIAGQAIYAFKPSWIIEILGSAVGYYAAAFALLLPMVFITHPATGKASKETIPWYDILLAVLAFGCLLWVSLNATKAIERGWTYSPPLYVSIIGIIICLLLLESARRTGDKVFALIVLIFALLPYYGVYLPGRFRAPRYSLLSTPSQYLFDYQAIFGPTTAALFEYIVGYFIFGAVIQIFGGGEYLVRLALTLVGGIRGATAKVAVTASAIFGTLSGSSIANVVTIGTVTIPAMKSSGYPPHYAAALEACSSTGGMIMPPVMGAVAFVMAQFTGIPYAKIALSAFIPAVLYYLAIFVQADLYAVKTGIKALPKEERPSFSFRLLLDGLDYFIAAGVLVYFIFGPQLEKEAPFIAILPLFAGAVIKRKFDFRKIWNLISGVGELLTGMVGLFGSLGMVIAGFMVTGVGLGISATMISMGGENSLLLVLLGGLVAVILGLGLSATPVYILTAILLAPALVQLGYDKMAVHLFILYYACVGAITPPVALTCLAAAKMAGAEYFKTSFQAMRLGIVMFLVPLFFVWQPSLVLQGTPGELLISLATVVFTILMFSVGFERQVYFVGKITRLEAFGAIICSFMVILPLASYIRMIGWVLATLLVVYWVGKAVFVRMRRSVTLGGP